MNEHTTRATRHPQSSGVGVTDHRFDNKRRQTGAGERYDHRHKKARADAATHHQPHHPCTRCAQPLGPMGPWLHYDHNDAGTGYLGFAHARCNLTAGARKGNALQATRRHTTPRHLPNW